MSQLIIVAGNPGSGKTWSIAGHKRKPLRYPNPRIWRGHQCLLNRHNHDEVDYLPKMVDDVGKHMARPTKLVRIGEKGLIYPWSIDGHHTDVGFNLRVRDLLARGHVIMDSVFAVNEKFLVPLRDEGHDVLVVCYAYPQLQVTQNVINRNSTEMATIKARKKSNSPDEWSRRFGTDNKHLPRLAAAGIPIKVICEWPPVVQLELILQERGAL